MNPIRLHKELASRGLDCHVTWESRGFFVHTFKFTSDSDHFAVMDALKELMAIRPMFAFGEYYAGFSV